MIKVVDWLCRVTAAIILLQTLFFKFTGAEESVHIFSTLNMEPWGRYATGIAELISAILLLIPRTTSIGSLLTLGIISGAIMGHLFKLGIIVNNDGGLLFTLAVIVFITSFTSLIINRFALYPYLKRIFRT